MFDWKCQSVAKHYLCFRHTLYSRHNFIHMSVRKSKGKVKSDTNDQLRQIAKAQRSNASLQCVRAIARNRRFLTSWQVLFLDVSDWQSPDWRRFVRLLFHRVPTLVQDWRAIMQCVAVCSVVILLMCTSTQPQCSVHWKEGTSVEILLMCSLPPECESSARGACVCWQPWETVSNCPPPPPTPSSPACIFIVSPLHPYPLQRSEKDQNCKLQFPQPDYWPRHSWVLFSKQFWNH